MSAPPKHIDPGELFARLAGPRPSKVIDFPRKDEAGKPLFQMAIVPLTEGELMACRAAAEAYARKMLDDESKTKTPGDSLGYKDLYINAVYVEYIARACRYPDELEMLVFPTGSPELRKRLYTDEIAVIFEACEIWQSESGPIVSRMGDGEMEAWIALLAEGASQVPLSALSSAAKNGLLLFMASRLHALRTDRSSPGSPLDVSAPTVDGEGPPPAAVADV
jgi:hypothetical protein